MLWPAWVRWLLWPLEQLYRLIVRVRAFAYARGWLRARRLPVKVVSVGNLTVGGTGKTPLVLRLATLLGQRGQRVAILTRGYGRRERMPLIINGRGETKQYTPELMGDEPILLSRRLPDVTIGIGSDRHLMGERILNMESSEPPDVFLLDDGFQHLGLARDLDIVVLDATNPFAGDAALPAGLLREPVAALQRADVVVLTRADSGTPPAVAERLQRHNPRAPVFRAQTRLEGVYDAATQRAANLYALKQQKVFAYCGIGNPEAFWEDLRRWGFELVGTLAFPDHHRYAINDFKAIIARADRAGARALLMTEKDMINLTVVPPSIPPSFYCRIELEFEDEAAFAAAVAERLELQAAGQAAR